MVKEKIIHYVKQYNLIAYVWFTISLCLTYPFLYYVLCQHFKVSSLNPREHSLVALLDLFYAGLWIYIVFTGLRRKRYKILTAGRYYEKDARDSQKTYTELVKIYKEEADKKISDSELSNTSWKNAEGIILGTTDDGKLYHIPSGKDGKNYFIFGLPSYGKTSGPIITSCLRWGMKHPLDETNKKTDGSVFCIDLKNDIWNATHKYRNIKCFSLINPENSLHFNPLEGIEKLSIDKRCNYIENLGFNIIPTGGDGNNKYFQDVAQDYFNGIALYLLSKDINTSFPTIMREILSGNAIDWVKKIIEDGSLESKKRLASKFGESEKNLSGGYSLLCQSCRKLSTDTLDHLLDNNKEHDFISPQALEDGYDVYIQLDQTELANYSSLLSMITQIFINAAISRDLNPNAGRLEDGTLRPIIFMLDEFAQLKTLKYEVIATAMMTLRSRNCSIVCALQSLSSISEMFHSENATKSLVDCITTFCFLSIQEVSTREWASKLIGTKIVFKKSNSMNHVGNGNVNSGQSVTEVREPFFQPEDFATLINRTTGKDEIIIYSNGKHIKLNKQYYFK